MKFGIFVMLAAALLIAIVAPQPMALAAAGFDIPMVFVAALVGFVSAFIVQALKDKFPMEIVDKFAVFVSGLVVAILNILSGVITAKVPEGLWPALTELFLYAASLLTAWGTFKLLFKKPEVIEAELLVSGPE